MACDEVPIHRSTLLGGGADMTGQTGRSCGDKIMTSRIWRAVEELGNGFQLSRRRLRGPENGSKKIKMLPSFLLARLRKICSGP